MAVALTGGLTASAFAQLASTPVPVSHAAVGPATAPAAKTDPVATKPAAEAAPVITTAEGATKPIAATTEPAATIVVAGATKPAAAASKPAATAAVATKPIAEAAPVITTAAGATTPAAAAIKPAAMTVVADATKSVTAATGAVATKPIAAAGAVGSVGDETRPAAATVVSAVRAVTAPVEGSTLVADVVKPVTGTAAESVRPVVHAARGAATAVAAGSRAATPVERTASATGPPGATRTEHAGPARETTAPRVTDGPAVAGRDRDVVARGAPSLATVDAGGASAPVGAAGDPASSDRRPGRRVRRRQAGERRGPIGGCGERCAPRGHSRGGEPVGDGRAVGGARDRARRATSRTRERSPRALQRGERLDTRRSDRLRKWQRSGRCGRGLRWARGWIVVAGGRHAGIVGPVLLPSACATGCAPAGAVSLSARAPGLNRLAVHAPWPA